MGDFNVNLLSRNKMLLDKQSYDSYSQAPPLAKKYMDLCFSHSLHQLIAEPTRTTKHAKTLIDHILTNFSEKVIQSGVIEIGLSDHGLIYPVGIYLFKVNNKIIIKMNKIIKYFTPCSSVSIVNFEDVNTDWILYKKKVTFETK